MHAELINRLRSIDNHAVALDLLFSEPQSSDPFADQLLAAAITLHGGIILPVAPIADSSTEYIYLAEPLNSYREHATLGHVDIELDSDGIARRVFLKAGVETPLWPALGLALATRLNRDTANPTDDLEKAHVKTWGRWVRSQEALIPYAGQPGSFQQVSYAQVLFDDQVLASLKDKIIIVGMTATGMGTRFATPVSPINRQPMSGVEWHANVLNMVLHNRAIHPIAGYSASLISVAWVLIVLLTISWLQRNISIPLLLIVLGCGLLSVWLSLRFLHIWFPPSAALIGTIAIYPLWNWRRINEFMQSLFVARVGSNAALESVADGVITTDTLDHIIYMNKGAEKILGVTLNQAQGVLLSALLDLNQIRDNSFAELNGSELPIPAFSVNTVQFYLKTVEGEKRAVRITRHLLRDDQEALMGFVIAIADITDTVELTKQVVYQASYDTLTQLPNRALLLTRFAELTSAPQQREKAISVFFVTLDNFKKINDALGHRAGDELLKMVSQRLNDRVHPNDLVARWGGDEFVMIFDHLNKEDTAPQMAQKILQSIRQKFYLHDQEVFVTVSIGISFFPEDGKDSETVLERASTAMHRVKNEGGNSFRFYSAESSVAWTRDRLEFEKELRAALNDGHLQVLYQPIVDVHQQRIIVRMEALVRWPHPTRGYLSPGDFLPLAESVGLMEQLGELVLRSACIAAQKLLQAGKPVNVSVNVNPRQLLYGNFTQTLSQVLSETKLPATSLILEITESAIVSDMARASDILTQIKALGALIALDDFGTGYSSLTLLRELPIDILKIDKSFIRALDQNLNDLTITQAIIGLGMNLNLAVIAEGVESEQQVRILLDHHCHLQQGYFFSRPVPYEAVLQLVNETDLSSPISIERLCSSVRIN